ncbi:dienelactone hydrolase family protein [Algivirga pacifica]|uniref:Dienelactone hydrolase domain-containing protein n=1 Tax=Algivirga pacifica TaxID=1162670 RepID=A0ABP9DEM1_9BACT
MKKLGIIFSLTLISITLTISAFMRPNIATPPKESRLCHSADIQQSAFTAFTNDSDFLKAHELPRAISFDKKKAKGKMISFKTLGGKKANAYYIKGDRKSNKYLLVFHEWWGLNEHIMQESELWAEKMEGVHVLAIDLYDGKVAETREKAGEYMKGVDTKRARNIIKGAINYCGRDKEFASIGWCFGGGWSLQSALIAEEDMRACIIYYGMPVTDSNILKRDLKAPVLGIFAEKDKWIDEKVVKEFEQSMTEAGKTLKVVTYDADHAFANPSSPRYNKEAAEAAQKESARFLKQYFLPK